MDSYEGLNLYWGDLHCHVREFRDQRDSSGPLGGVSGPYTLEVSSPGIEAAPSGAGTPVSPGELTISASLEVTYNIQ